MSTSLTQRNDQPSINASWRGDLPALIKELERQKASRVDFIADTRSLTFAPMDQSGIAVTGSDAQTNEFFTSPQVLSDRALGQFGERVTPSIPAKYLRELTAAFPGVASLLLNSMATLDPNRLLIRCLDNRVRAILSNKYRIFDDLDIAFSAMDSIQKNDGTILECTASEAKFDIKFTALHMVDFIPEDRGGTGSEKALRRTTLNPADFKHLGKGACCPFVRVSHSSVGDGGLNVSYGLLRLACLNGAITDSVLNQIHLGAANNIGLITEETIAAESKAIMLKARDLISASLKPDTFKQLISTAKGAAADVITAPTTAIHNLVENSGLTESARESILAHFLRDYDQTRWGLAQAVSRYGQDLDAPEDAAQFENLSGSLIKSNKLLAIA